MNTLFKKHFWAVQLGGLAFLALVTAGLVNDAIIAKFFVLPSAGAVTAPASKAAPDATFGRIAGSTQATQDLLARRVFRLEEPAPPAPAEPEVPAQPTEEPAAFSGELELSTLPITLVGTFVSTVPDYSYATLQISGESKVASTGSEYLDGKAKVVKIAAGHVVLKEDRRYTYVSLWDGRQAGAPGQPFAGPAGFPPPNTPAAGNRPMPMPTPDAPPSVSAADPSTGVTKTGAYDYSIDRKMLDQQLADMQKLQSEARVVPNFKDNKQQGFKLVGVRPGSLYRSLGIRSGDVITAVNGTKIDSPNKALELFEQLKHSNNISVEIERRGQAKTLGYTVQ